MSRYSSRIRPRARAGGQAWSAFRGGFTLVEMLVVIAIIGILVALILPAVEVARESARRTDCSNNLMQIGIAFQNHHDAQGHLPTGGWGWNWVGDPDAGFGVKQPGGWVYNILPYMEQSAVHDMALGATGTAKDDATAKMISTVIRGFNCPTRRLPQVFPTPYKMYNATMVNRVAKTDYAANCGSQGRNEIDGGPGPGTGPPAMPTLENGISYRCSRVRLTDIRDGTSSTIAVGEKYLALLLWATGSDAADNENMYCGYDNDVYRSTNGTIYFPPRSDMQNIVQYTYGSAHPAGFNVVMCDSSVRAIVYDIDRSVYECLGARNDKQVISGRF